MTLSLVLSVKLCPLKPYLCFRAHCKDDTLGMSPSSDQPITLFPFRAHFLEWVIHKGFPLPISQGFLKPPGCSDPLLSLRSPLTCQINSRTAHLTSPPWLTPLTVFCSKTHSGLLKEHAFSLGSRPTSQTVSSQSPSLVPFFLLLKRPPSTPLCSLSLEQFTCSHVLALKPPCMLTVPKFVSG